MPTLTAPRRLLASPVVDLLLGPHGVDRYLELIRPSLAINEPRAEVLHIGHQTERSVTLTLRPNDAWSGFRPGQFVRVGVEIDGVRHTRTYSPTGSAHSPDQLELTVTIHPGGLVSNHLYSHVRPGNVLYLSQAQGEFLLPDPRPEHLVLISGGSGITPVLSMLRTLCAERHDQRVTFLHYARTAADWLYRDEVTNLAARHPNVSVHYLATREGGGHLSDARLRVLLGGREALGHAHAAVCGPPALIEAVNEIWAAYPDGGQRVISETFTPPSLSLKAAAAAEQATVHFARSERSVSASGAVLLEQAEAAGLNPEFGCRMGICHTCTCRKTAGAVRNVLTGEVSDDEDEDIQLCISVPAGDVALDL